MIVLTPQHADACLGGRLRGHDGMYRGWEPSLGCGLYRGKNPIEIHGTAATTIKPTSRAARYGQIGRTPSEGSTRPMAQAA